MYSFSSEAEAWATVPARARVRLISSILLALPLKLFTVPELICARNLLDDSELGKITKNGINALIERLNDVRASEISGSEELHRYPIRPASLGGGIRGEEGGDGHGDVVGGSEHPH